MPWVIGVPVFSAFTSPAAGSRLCIPEFVGVLLVWFVAKPDLPTPGPRDQRRSTRLILYAALGRGRRGHSAAQQRPGKPERDLRCAAANSAGESVVLESAPCDPLNQACGVAAGAPDV